MTDKELAAIKATLAQATVYPSHTAEERLYLDAPIAFAQNVIRLAAEVERLQAREAREALLLAVARKVAEADNSDHGVCYQLCSYDMHWTDDDHQVMTHNTPCVVEQARALLGLE